MQVQAFEPGQRVEKLTGYYKDEGFVLAAFYTRSGELHYAIETDAGKLRICQPRSLLDPDRKRPPLQLDFWDS